MQIEFQIALLKTPTKYLHTLKNGIELLIYQLEIKQFNTHLN